MYNICDDNYILNGLVDATSDSKQFGFHKSNTNYMIYCFLDKI